MALLGTLVVAIAGVLAACGDGAVGELGNAPSGGVESTNGRFTTLVPDGGAHADGGHLSPSEQAFAALLPELSRACGGACHVDGKGNAPAWIAPPNAYAAIKAYKGIVVKDVGTSTMLSKGRHEGPDLVDPLRGKIQDWLQLEAVALQSATLPTTDLFRVYEGANTVDISKGGTNVTGAKLTFTAAFVDDILTMTDLKIAAPAAAGVHVVFPIVITSTLTGEERRDTSFSNADQSFAAGQTSTLNPGLLILTGWSQEDRMRIEFTKLEGATVTQDAGADSGPSTTGGGCKSVGLFTANAVPAIQANGCLNCHNTGGSGNGAMDLSALMSQPADDARACAQALARISPSDPAKSDIILAPTGGVANHPFKGASPSFVSMMETWIASEK